MHQIAAHQAVQLGVQGVAEPDFAAVFRQMALDLVGGHSQAHGAVGGLVVADMPHPFFDHQLAGIFAVPQHAHPPLVPVHPHHGGAAFVAGGLGFFIGNIKAAFPADKAAPGHQFHAVPVVVLFHYPVDADQILLAHGRSFLFLLLCVGQ